MIEFFKSFRGELVTTWPIITETCHLLSKNQRIQIDFLEWIELGGLKIEEIPIEKIQRIIQLTKKHKDIPMDLGDAILVILAEEEKIFNIISIDSDYDIYRIFKKEKFNNLYRKFLTTKKLSDFASWR